MRSHNQIRAERDKHVAHLAKWKRGKGAHSGLPQPRKKKKRATEKRPDESPKSEASKPVSRRALLAACKSNCGSLVGWPAESEPGDAIRITLTCGNCGKTYDYTRSDFVEAAYQASG